MLVIRIGNELHSGSFYRPRTEQNAKQSSCHCLFAKARPALGWAANLPSNTPRSLASSPSGRYEALKKSFRERAWLGGEMAPHHASKSVPHKLIVY